jgi:hypothetical protein
LRKQAWLADFNAKAGALENYHTDEIAGLLGQVNRAEYCP